MDECIGFLNLGVIVNDAFFKGQVIGFVILMHLIFLTKCRWTEVTFQKLLHSNQNKKIKESLNRNLSLSQNKNYV